MEMRASYCTSVNLAATVGDLVVKNSGFGLMYF